MLKAPDDTRPHPRFEDFRRPRDTQQAYFEALEILRGHLSRCLGQIAAIAGMEAPTEGLIAKYRGPWSVDVYVVPTLANERATLS